MSGCMSQNQKEGGRRPPLHASNHKNVIVNLLFLRVNHFLHSQPKFLPNRIVFDITLSFMK